MILSANVPVRLMIVSVFYLSILAVSVPAFSQDATIGGGRPPQRVGNRDFVGAEVCAQCHSKENQAWTGSHHQLAMQEANASSVLGDFNDAKFLGHGVETIFFKRAGKFYVRTDGADGRLADFEISYTFGVFPLQQYLIAFPGGRLQALSIAWDSRPKEEGGQRWFDLHPRGDADAGGQLHWTSLYQTWNLQCAECHSTNLRKGYNFAARTYATTFTEIDVSCEACHGPGARHVDWATKATGPNPTDDKGLAISLRSRWQEAWRFPSPDAAIARRDRPADQSLMNVCANCHSLRSTLSEGEPSGHPPLDSHRAALLLPPNYHADGQQREEVYVWGSFQQSKMFQAGVTCMDCHEPHTLKLRAEDNALCGRCHNPEVFDSEKHSFHKTGSAGALCANCHMPAQNYMVVDARRDHAIRVPRPDVSMAVGSPNACTTCHSDHEAAWAAEAMDRWYGTKWRGRPTDAFALHAAVLGDPRSVPKLLDIAKDGGRAGIVRASALALAQPLMRQDAFVEVPALLTDADPAVRLAAVDLTERLAPASRLSALGGSLQDDVRGVRIRAATLLAGVSNRSFPDNLRGAQVQALQEYINSLQLNADWPGTNVNMGELYAQQGRMVEARGAFRRAIELDPKFTAAYVNLADLERSQGDDTKAEATLREGLNALPDSPDLHHALGLTLVRKGDQAAALAELAEAARRAPDNARYGYVYAIGLNSAGHHDEAVDRLREINRQNPFNIEVLSALVSFYREAGDLGHAAAFASAIAELLPGDRSVQRLLQDLRRSP